MACDSEHVEFGGNGLEQVRQVLEQHCNSLEHGGNSVEPGSNKSRWLSVNSS